MPTTPPRESLVDDLLESAPPTLGAPDAPRVPAPELIGPHPVRRLLGEGGMGAVYEVEDADLGRLLAAKLTCADAPGARARFVEEARLTGQLEHPGIAPVHALGSSEDGLYYTMRRIDGRTLTELLHAPADERPSLIALLTIFGKVCDAVGYAHSQGVIHRDLKPDNVMVGHHGEVLVVDWGIARRVALTEPLVADSGIWPAIDDTQRTTLGEIVGTLAYMPPEQARGEVDKLDRRSDVYALGAILYEALTGCLPYDEDHWEALADRILEGDLVPPSQRAPGRAVPWELEAVVMRAMAPKRHQRYQSVSELQADVQAFLSGRMLSAATYSRLQRLTRWARRHWAVLAVGLPLGLGLLLTAGLSVARRIEDAGRIRRALTDAEQQRDVARREREDARRQRDEARRQRAELLRLADVKRLAQLREQALSLWLVEPTPAACAALTARIQRWLSEAAALIGHRDLHRGALAALPPTGPSGEDADVSRAWRREVLSELVVGLERLSAEDGLMAEVRARAGVYGTLAKRSLSRHRTAWDGAVAAIRRAPAYGGLRIAPQLGLVPLGPDPASGLWEFAVLDSGRLPERRADGALERTAETAIVLVLLPAARYAMGARPPAPGEGTRGPSIDPAAKPEERPVHSVALRAVFIGKTEVTQGQWRTITGTNPSLWRRGRGTIDERHPVDSVSWDAAARGLARVGLRLPTEAQWEYAARAGTRTRWWTGDDPRSLAGAANLADRRYVAGGGQGAHERWLDDGNTVHAPVAAFRANGFGLHDVHGNLYEWCQDRYVADAYRRPLTGDGSGARRLPPATGVVKRVLRGGCWSHDARFARSARRTSSLPAVGGPTAGIRAARPLYD